MALTLAAVFVSVGLATGWLASSVLSRRTSDRQRLETLARSGGRRAAPADRALDALFDRMPERFSRIVPRSPNELSRLRRRMLRAGHHGGRPIVVYSLAKTVCPVAFAAVPLLLVPFSQSWLLAALAGAIGCLLPAGVLRRQIRRRQRAIRNGLPDALDLLVVCLEAGSALDQAIVTVSDELAITCPALARELRLVTTEIRAGTPRIEAFKHVAERTGVDEMRALVAMLVQTDRFGTSVAAALRTHAATARTKRRQRAEERAERVNVQLVFPLVLFLFPAFYVVTLGPAVLQFVRVFFGELMQQ